MFETAARLDRSVQSQHYRLSPSVRAELAQGEEKKRAAEKIKGKEGTTWLPANRHFSSHHHAADLF